MRGSIYQRGVKVVQFADGIRVVRNRENPHSLDLSNPRVGLGVGEIVSMSWLCSKHPYYDPPNSALVRWGDVCHVHYLDEIDLAGPDQLANADYCTPDVMWDSFAEEWGYTNRTVMCEQFRCELKTTYDRQQAAFAATSPSRHN